MLIQQAQPLVCQKRVICRGDEAIITRLEGAGRYNGMVERLQRLDELGIRCFDLKDTNGKHYKFLTDELGYHLAKFLSGLLARRLLPEHFVDFMEMRFSYAGKGNGIVAVYSNFVEDENGAIERWTKIRERTSRLSWMAARGFRASGDKYENRLNGDLVSLEREYLRGGVVLSHPAANYHICNGKTVFFEVGAIEMEGIVRTFLERPDFEGAIYASILAGIAFKESNLGAKEGGGHWHISGTKLEDLISDLFLAICSRDLDLVLRVFSMDFLTSASTEEIESMIVSLRNQRFSEQRERATGFLRTEIDPWIFDRYS